MSRVAFRRGFEAHASFGALGVALAVCLCPVSALAQSQLLSNGGGFVTQPSAVVTVNQGAGSNAAGVVQLDNNPDTLLTQTGYYNRAAIIQMGSAGSTTKVSDALQTGTYNRLLVIQGPGGVSNSQTNAQGPATALANYAYVSQAAVTLSLEEARLVAQNFLNGPEVARVNLGVLQDVSLQFSSALADRLDMDRAAGCGQQLAKAPCSTQPYFIAFDYGHTRRHDALGVQGYADDVRSVVIGGSFALSKQVKVGLAASFADTDADINGGMGRTKAKTYQLGAFASLAGANYHIDAITTVAMADFNGSRNSGAYTVSSATDGIGFTARMQAGYSWRAAGLRIGPVASLTYVSGTIDGYGETGNIWLTQRFGQQTGKDLFGTVGAEIRYGDGATALNAYAKVELEYDFGITNFDEATSNFDFAPTLLVRTPLAAGTTSTYGKISAGLRYTVAPGLAVSLSGRGVVGNARLDRFAVMGGVAFAF